MAEIPIPSGYSVPLVEVATKRLPAPTVAAHKGVDYAGLGGDGRVPESQVPLYLSSSALSTKFDAIKVNAAEARWGIPLSGEADAKPAFDSLLKEVLPGSIIAIKGELLRFDSFLTIPVSKKLTFEWYESRIVRNHSGYLMRANATPEAFFSVLSIVTATKSKFGQSYTFARLTLSSPPVGWQTGDRVRIIADNYQPTSRYKVSDSAVPLIGEWADIDTIDGNVVDLKMTLRDSYVTNVRICRVPEGSVRHYGGEWDVSDDVFDNKLPGGASPVGGSIRCIGLVDPWVIDQTVIREVGPPVSMRANNGYHVENQLLKYARNAPDDTPSIVGYGVLDQGSMYGYVNGLRAIDGRHSFTDVSPVTPLNGTDPFLYGRTMFADIYRVVANGTGNSAIDTHHGSYGITYHAPVCILAPGNHAGIGIRGEGHRFLQPRIVGGAVGAKVFNDTTGSGAGTAPESYGHHIEGMILEGTSQAVEVSVHGAGHLNEGTRGSERNLTVSGLRGVGVQRIGSATNAHLVMRDVDLDLPASVIGPVISNLNSTIDIEGRVDAKAVTTATGFSASVEDAPRLWYGGITSINKIKLALASSAAYQTAVGSEPFYATTNTDTAYFNVLFENPWLGSANMFRVQDTVRRASIDWEIASDTDNTATQASSDTLEIVGANLETAAYPARLLRSRKKTLWLLARTTSGTARTLAALGPGKFIGQELIVTPSSISGAFTVGHGVGKLTSLIGATDKVLVVGQFLRLVWLGTAWVQTQAV